MFFAATLAKPTGEQNPLDAIWTAIFGLQDQTDDQQTQIDDMGTQIDNAGTQIDDLNTQIDDLGTQIDARVPKTNNVTISPIAFGVHASTYGSPTIQSGSSAVILYADVKLPQGATITRLKVAASDTLPGDDWPNFMSVQLWRQSLKGGMSGGNDITSVSTTDSVIGGSILYNYYSAETTSLAKYIGVDHVNNNEALYMLKLTMYPESAPGFTEFYGAFVEYTYP